MSTPRRLSALFLALLLCLPLPAGASSPYPDKAHGDVDYADMALESFDDATLQSAVDGLAMLRTLGALRSYTPHTRDSVQYFIDAILDEYAHMETQYYLWGIASDAHAGDEALAQAYLDYAQGFDRASDLCWDALCLLTDTPYEDLLPIYPGPAPDGDTLGPSSETLREQELSLREETLIRQYQQVMAREVWSTPYGEWSWAELNDADLSDEDYDLVSTALEQAENEAAGPIFLELLSLRREIAELNGYDSYADYTYEVLYGRDYTPGRARDLSRRVAEELGPVYDRILEEKYDEIDALIALPVASGENIWLDLGPWLNDLHPDLGSAWEYMMDHHLYDVEASPDKTFAGYTVPLAQYGTAFIFDSPYGNYQDYSSLIHEFGHFAQAHYDPTPALWAWTNTDLGEVHSQGLEALFTHYAEDLFPGHGEGFVWATLWSMVDSALEGCMYDRFQQEVYALDDPTLEEVNTLFKTVSEEFGYSYDSHEAESFFWVENAHTFSQPFYYISYATSALTALDLWLTAQEDWEGAVEAYMALSAMDDDVSYTSALARVDLPSVFRSGTVPALAEALTAALDGKSSLGDRVGPSAGAGDDLPGAYTDREREYALVLGERVGYLLGGLLLLWIIFRLVRRGLVKAAGRATNLSHPGKEPPQAGQRKTPAVTRKKTGTDGGDPWTQDRKTGPWDPTKDPWE